VISPVETVEITVENEVRGKVKMNIVLNSYVASNFLEKQVSRINFFPKPHRDFHPT
jgi:hypothetical protein